MSLVVEELMSFVYLNFNVFPVLSHNLVSDWWNREKINSEYFSEMMHVKFMSMSSGVEELLSFDRLSINKLVHSEP